MTIKKYKRYLLGIDPNLFSRFKKHAEKEYKLVNVKIVELILNYVKEKEVKK